MAAALAASSLMVAVFVVLLFDDDQLVLGLGFFGLNRSISSTAAASGGDDYHPRSPQVPAVIVFGDSIVDPGNNNQLPTIAKSNFPPYGQDFAGHRATGRFSNGKIPPDFISSMLGVKELVPPYIGVELSPEDILTGVCFASGGAGYDPLTSQLANVISMKDQLKLFGEYKKKVMAIAGEEAGADIISKAFYAVCSGSNDIANTYFATFRQAEYDLSSYVDFLVTSTTEFLRELVGMGAKVIGFVSIPPLGCLPSQRTVAGGILRECDSSRNQAAILYNTQMQKAIQRLNSEMHGLNVIYLDIYYILLDFFQRPAHYGFEEANRGCCGTGLIEVTPLCNSLSTTCDDVNKYVFWDSFHPTENVYRILVDYLYQNYLKYV